MTVSIVLCENSPTNVCYESDWWKQQTTMSWEMHRLKKRMSERQSCAKRNNSLIQRTPSVPNPFISLSCPNGRSRTELFGCDSNRERIGGNRWKRTVTKVKRRRRRGRDESAPHCFSDSADIKKLWYFIIWGDDFFVIEIAERLDRLRSIREARLVIIRSEEHKGEAKRERINYLAALLAVQGVKIMISSVSGSEYLPAKLATDLDYYPISSENEGESSKGKSGGYLWSNETYATRWAKTESHFFPSSVSVSCSSPSITLLTICGRPTGVFFFISGDASEGVSSASIWKTVL